MKSLFALLFISFFVNFYSTAQTYEWLKPRLAHADTIVLASHEDFGSIDYGNSVPVPVPEWVIGGRPNYKVLIKHKILTPAQRIELSRVLLRPFRDNKIVTTGCCQPHHILFLVRSGHTSYLDICFGCRCLHSSQDLSRLYVFDNRKWDELDKFFTKLGLEYAR